MAEGLTTTERIHQLESDLEAAEELFESQNAELSRLRSQVETLTKELSEAEIRIDRADGALADAGDIPTGDIERGIRRLTEERDAWRAATGLASMTPEEAGEQIDREDAEREQYKSQIETLTEERDAVSATLLQATEAFNEDGPNGLGVINESVQPLIDAVVAWGDRIIRSGEARVEKAVSHAEKAKAEVARLRGVCAVFVRKGRYHMEQWPDDKEMRGTLDAARALLAQTEPGKGESGEGE